MKEIFNSKVNFALLIGVLVMLISPFNILCNLSIVLVSAIVVTAPTAAIFTLLFLIAVTLLIILAPLGLLITLSESIRQEIRGRKIGLKKVGIDYAAGRMKDNGLSLDIFGNVILKELFDVAMLKRSADTVPFGNTRASISGVLGLNQERETLSLVGKMLASFLDLIDENHCAKAADNNRKYFLSHESGENQ